MALDEVYPEPKPGEGGKLNPVVQGQHHRVLLQEELRPCMWNGQCLSLHHISSFSLYLTSPSQWHFFLFLFLHFSAGLPQVPLWQPDLRAGHPLLWLLHQGLHSQVGTGKIVTILCFLPMNIFVQKAEGSRPDCQPLCHQQPAPVHHERGIHRRLVSGPAP